jgi:hypothetical protein
VVQGVPKRTQKAADGPNFSSASQEALAAVRHAEATRATLVTRAALQPVLPRGSSNTSMHSVSSSATSADVMHPGHKKHKTTHGQPTADNPEEQPSQASSSVLPQDLSNKFDAVASLRDNAVTSLRDSWQSASTETLPWGETESVQKKPRMMNAAVLTSLCSYVASSLNVRVLA